MYAKNQDQTWQKKYARDRPRRYKKQKEDVPGVWGCLLLYKLPHFATVDLYKIHPGGQGRYIYLRLVGAAEIGIYCLAQQVGDLYAGYIACGADNKHITYRVWIDVYFRGSIAVCNAYIRPYHIIHSIRQHNRVIIKENSCMIVDMRARGKTAFGIHGKYHRTVAFAVVRAVEQVYIRKVEFNYVVLRITFFKHR